MEHEMILIFVWAIIMTITLGILVVVLLNLKKKHEQNILEKENEIQDMNNKLQKKQIMSFRAGISVTSGDYSQILGDFALLSKYDSIITLSTTFSQASLDLIGINSESIDFLELKKKGAGSTKNEMHVKRLVDEKKVFYKIYDVELPNNFTIKERELKETKRKENKPKEITAEEKKSRKDRVKTFMEAKYRKWTESDDEFLKNYWNDKSNTQSEHEKIQELSKKFDRSNGAIVSRLEKNGLY